MRIMIGLLVAALAGPALLPGVVPDQTGAARLRSADWMGETEGVLELKLAHEEKGRPDGGTLRIDSNKRLVLWEGIPGEFGCKLKIEASFDEVDDISVSELAGFVLDLKKGKTRRLVLIPVPHAWWFKQQWKAQFGNFAKNVPEGTLRDHDGPMTVSAAEAGAGASLKHREIPKDVAKDTRTAADAIRMALGRGPLH